jgi:hypothetical protein
MPGKMVRSDPRPGVRVTRGAGTGQHLASVLQEGRENANIDAGLGFIWRISNLKDEVDLADRITDQCLSSRAAPSALRMACYPHGWIEPDQPRPF